jgi:photosystem II stability/assembly factor-like uncharacterized protein
MRYHSLGRFLILWVLCLLGLSLVAGSRAGEDEEEEVKGGPASLKRLKFRNIGPAAGGRVCRSAGVPGDPLTYYAATAAGGVWKSEDGGKSWKPLMDDQPTSTIGSLAIAPSDANVIYAGSGEANIRGNVEVGNGIYKSVDAGKTWKHVREMEGQIGTLIVHPTNPNIAFAAVLGKAFGPSRERGVLRTTDGGKSWITVLFRDADTGASDVCFDPGNPHILFAGLWQVRRRPWEMTSGGPGSGLYVSRDGGDTWLRLVRPPEADAPEASKEPPPGIKRCPGLPKGIWGKVSVRVAPSDSRRIYALIEAEEGGLFRSNDGGDTWDRVNESRAIRQRAWYFSTLTIDPGNADVVWFPQVPLLKTIDGGKSLLRVKGPHHGDHHDIWIDPKNPRRIVSSNDGGVDISINGGASWFAPQLPISQFYHIDVDNSKPYRVAGSMQDIGTASGPSNSLTAGGIPLSAWYPVGGGEAGHVSFDPADPNIVYATEYGGYLSRYDYRTRQARNISIYPFDPSGHGAEDLHYRFQWTAPVLASKHEPHTVYHAANVLFVTRDDGKRWTKLSDDLTRNDKSKQKWSGGPITGDNTGVEVYGTIFALAESPVKEGVLWAGSDDGLVHLTTDGGKSWNNVTPKALPEWATITCIEASPFDAGTALVVADNHRLDDRKPYLFRTTDFGKSWTSLSEKVPVAGFLNVVREDPKKKGMLYVGWEKGLVYSLDGGDHWENLKLNFPTVRVSDLVVKGDDLVVGTNGRSIWILDDLTPLRQMQPAGKEVAVHLFAPRPAVRYRLGESGEWGGIHWKGPNPPYGVIVNYHLKSVPEGEITLTIREDKGRVVRKLTSKKPEEEPQDEGSYSVDEWKEPRLPKRAGLQRAVWDLRHQGAEIIKGARLDGGQPRSGPLVVPGTYTLELSAGGKTVTEKVVVEIDPREVRGKVAAQIRRLQITNWAKYEAAAEYEVSVELREQEKLALQIRDDITQLTRTVEQLRSIRKQIAARNDLLKGQPSAEALVKASKDLLPKLEELEEKLHNPKAKVSYDILAQKGGAKLYSQLAWLLEQLKDADGPPTQGMREVYAEQHELLHKYRREWEALVKKEIGGLNDLARKQELPGLYVPSGERKKE